MARIALLFAIALVACGPTVKNGNGDDGTDGGNTPSCSPGATQSCYSGAPGTQGVGPCTGGTQTCDVTGYWGPCLGEVAPKGEVCGNSVDDNCNGTVDEDVDADGDGITTCGGDCCDSTNDGCADPKLVNPGAFEAPGNMVDDDCDGMVDNVAAATCDTGIASNSSNAMDYAKAMELCQTATMADKKWGVISARFARADGNNAPDASQYSIRQAFGGTTVKGGSSFAILSTGAAAAQGQTNPDYVAFDIGKQIIVTNSPVPADWLAANGGNIPNAPNCPAPSDKNAHDPVMLELTIRTPTNAKSFSFASNFFSSEYPEWTCSKYNDFFVVLLDSTWNGTPANPADKNLAIYKSGNNVYPVGVNLASGNTGLFTQCVNGQTGCSSGKLGTITTCTSTAQLVGTGMDIQYGGCPGSTLMGGATGWLETSGNVKGGEIIKLRIAIWDTSDSKLDSVSIIDNFQWSVEASQPGTVIF